MFVGNSDIYSIPSWMLTATGNANSKCQCDFTHSWCGIEVVPLSSVFDGFFHSYWTCCFSSTVCLDT